MLTNKVVFFFISKSNKKFYVYFLKNIVEFSTQFFLYYCADMFFKRIIIISYFLIFNFYCFYAQMNYQQKYQLIQSYMLQKEYEKALPLIKDVYEISPEYWFDLYYEALTETKNYAEAEKLIFKQLKKFPHDAQYYVFLGHLYDLQNNSKKARSYYDKSIDKLPKDVSGITTTAKQFLKYQLIDDALRCYEKGIKLTGYLFNYERAEIYYQKKDYKSLINLYLDILYSNPGELYNVQNQFQSLLSYNSNDTTQVFQPILKQELIKRIQKYPESSVYSEFLIYLLLQQNDYEQAFIQIKAYDKRNNDDGLKLFQFCQLCSKNEQYHIAGKCFEEVLKKGKNNPFYESAKIEYMQNKFQDIVHSGNISIQDIEELKNEMYKYIQQNQNSPFIYPLIFDLADIYSKYLKNKSIDKADSLLNHYINQSSVNSNTKAKMKLKLADIYVLQNNFWSAILLCMQVEKDFKYDPLGQEAQLKRAQISFYSGEFQLAKSQADILKGATSKLIANDALQLSMIISNALFNDSTGNPLKYYAKANLMIFQNNLDDAIATLDSINQKFTNHSLEDDIFFQKAKIFEMKKDWKNAEQMYLNIINYYPQEMYADDAVFYLAKLYQYQLNDKNKAMEYYLKLLNDYPGSLYVPEARKLYRFLRGDEANNQ